MAKEYPIGIALHQWKRGNTVRKLIHAPDGFLVVEFDFSGQEMRLIAGIAPEHTMIELFNHGKDVHSYTASGIVNKPYDWIVENRDTDAQAYQDRYLGKFAGLALNYRIGIDKMRVQALVQYGLNLSDSDARHVKQAYLSLYPGIPTYWKQQVRFARANGYVETASGRRYPLGDLDDYANQQTAINAPIQGTGAEMKYLALACVSPAVRRMGGKFAFDLHDGLFFYLPDDSTLQDNMLELRHTLSNLPYKRFWGWEPPLQFPVDCEYGPSWGEMRKLK